MADALDLGAPVVAARNAAGERKDRSRLPPEPPRLIEVPRVRWAPYGRWSDDGLLVHASGWHVRHSSEAYVIYRAAP